MSNYVPIPIKTSKYVKTLKVDIDGNIWDMRSIGGADQMAIGQAERRVNFLQSKIDKGEATEADLDLYDQLEVKVVSIVSKLFSDGSDRNSQVKEWLAGIPLSTVFKIIEDIVEQSEKNDEKAPEQSTKPE